MKRIGLFPGTFSNFHLGHIDLIKKSLLLFDKVFLVIAKNKNKNANLNKNYQNVLRILENYNFKNLIVIKSNKRIPILFDELNATHIIRGIRDNNDLLYELELIDDYKKMNKKINEIFFITDKNLRDLSSSNKKIFIFDIDGTILNDEKKILKSTKIAISILLRKGHEVILCTGRSYNSVFKISNELKIQNYLITSGGSIIYDIKKKVAYISKKFVNKKDINLMINLAQKYKRELVWNNGKKLFRVYFGVDPKKEINDYKYFIGGSHKNPKFDKWDDVKNTVYKNILQISFKAEAKIIKNEIKNLKKNISKNSICFETSEVYIDLLNYENNKYNAIKKILDNESININNIYTFGDSENDLEMLSKFPNGIAMGNARENVKKKSKYIIGNNNEDSIYNFLYSKGFINE